MQLLQRRLSPQIEHSLATDRVTAIMGPRQTGKTTLARHLLKSSKKTKYYNLKDPSIRQRLKVNARQEFTHAQQSTIILDEVQMLPALFEIIQLQVDETPEYTGRFLLLGSNHLLLNRHIKESLAGRVALFTLLPLACSEFLQNDQPSLLEQIIDAEDDKACSSLLNQYYQPASEGVRAKEVLSNIDQYGAYPEFILRRDAQDRKNWLANYHQTYLETDLRQLVDIKNPESFEIFESLFAQRVGSLLNVSSLSRDCALSADTLRRFIHYYQQLFISWQARPFHANTGKRMIKMSKHYYYDTGVLRSVLDDFSPFKGALFENTVLSEIKKILGFVAARKKLFFSRTSTGVETDGYFVANNGKTEFFIEIKQSTKTRRQDIRHLKKYVEGKSGRIGLLINRGDKLEALTDNIWAVPATSLLG